MASLPKALLKDGRRLILVVPAIVLLLCLVALYLTRNAMADLGFLTTASTSLVDQRPWQTVQAIAPLAVSAEEQNFAQQAERLADHEVDQAFALALRQATTQPKAVSAEASALNEKIATLRQEIKADQDRVQSLGGEPAKTAEATSAPENDDLDAARTQLQLDSDELADAQENLARATGDKRAAIQQELASREAAMKKSATAGNGKTAIVSAKSRGTLSARINAWFDQKSRRALILQAQHQAESDAADLQKQHVEVEKQSGAAAAAAANANLTPTSPASSSTPEAVAVATVPNTRAARLQLLRTLSEEHSIVDDRLDTQRQLASIYGKWAAQVDRQHAIVFHLMLRSFALIAFIVLLAVIAVALVETFVNRSTDDTEGAIAERRRLHTLRTIADLAIEVVAVLLVLLVVFGAPSQMPTILGLATAGITVVFQDFILAFFGWFVLMGKHGIRVGDWVEINSVGGEVVEIGLFRTTLMETGNWTDKGHPTGRRVTFINNFAITGQFFNFSTVGQWMWDEIAITIPSGDAAFTTIEAIRQRVIAETSRDAHLADAEWRRATTQQSLSQFTASPSVDLRPAAAGIDIIVRYVTRAGDRFEMRNRIYQAMIDILHLQPEALPAPSEAGARN